MEKIKLQVDILKIKLTFFTGLTGGVSYLFLNIEKLAIYNTFVSYILFVLLFLYSVIGVFINISFLSKNKYLIILREILKII